MCPPQSQATRIENRNCAISREIVSVERKDVGYPVYYHRCNKAGVVGLLAGNRVCDDQATPLTIDLVPIRQTKDGTLNPRDYTVSLTGAEAGPVADLSESYRPAAADRRNPSSECLV
jgi:hypothetical protein